MASASLHRLFSPKSVAVVGGRVAESVVEEMHKLGYAGDIWPVNPKRAEMAGVACFASIDDLPAAPDAAYLGIPRDAAIDTVARLSKMGAGGAICHASGFAELGDKGKQKNAALIAAAGNMPVIGPNCWGVLNLMDRAAMWPDFHGAAPVDDGVAIINQSGNMALNYTMQRRGLAIAMVVTLGNQAMIDANDCIETLLDDPRIHAIGLHIEGLTDVVRFSSLAISARDANKPLVVFKTGISDKGAHATVSHTATLAGSDDLHDALFRRHGIARVHSVPEFLETLKLVSTTGPMRGNRLASLSCSGGEASLIADRVEARSLTLPDLTAEHANQVRQTVNEFVDITNPLDYHTFIWGQYDAMKATYGAMMAGGFDMTALILDYPRQDRSRYAEYNIAIDAWIDAAKSHQATTSIIATLPECMPEQVALKLVDNGVVPFFGMEEALAAMEVSLVWNQSGAQPIRSPVTRDSDVITLDEAASKDLLRQSALPIPTYEVVDPSNATAAAERIGYPVVLKATGLSHKTEAGGVRLRLGTAEAVSTAARQLATISDRLLVEAMIEDSVCELIVGIKRDDQFGLALVIGAGGIFAELMQDSTALLFPVTRHDIDRALASLKIDRLLRGYRGRKSDRQAAIDTIKQVADLAEQYWDTLVELDINPLIVREPGHGVSIADALVRIRT